MGYYIETNSHKNKAKWLMENAKAQLFAAPLMPSREMIPVIVIDNGPFEAAGIAFNEQELEAFTSPDDYRLKTWLLVPREEVLRLNPKVEQHLKW